MCWKLPSSRNGGVQETSLSRGSRLLSCVCTQEIVFTCDMNTVLGHWRHHLTSRTCSFINPLCDKEGRKTCNFLDSKELIGICLHTDICEHKDMRTYEIECSHNKYSQMTRQILFSDSSYRQCVTHTGHRPYTMMVSDYSMISEMSLGSVSMRCVISL